MEDVLVLGQGAMPDSGAQLESLVRDLFARSGVDTAGAPAVGIAASMDGANIESLDVDCSGLAVTVPLATAGADIAQDFGPTTSTQEALLGRLRVHAEPLMVNGVELTLDANVESLPFTWLRDAHSRIAVAQAETATGQSRVHATAETDTAAVVAAAEVLLAGQLEGEGVTVSDLTVNLSSPTPRSAHVEVGAKLRKGILGATATFSADALLDDDMVLHLSDVKLSSRNPIVAALLLTVRERVDAAVAEPIDLNGSMPAWLQLRDVQWELGERLRIEARLG